jgi:hypothetical protein
MKSYLTTLILAVILAFGCKLNKPNDQIDYNIPDEFQLSLTEIRDSATGVADLAFHFKSTNLYDCSGVGIQNTFLFSGDKINISLQKVIQPLVCDGISAPAGALISIGKPKIGNFGCMVTLGGVVPNIGSLTVSAESVSLAFAESAGIVVRTADFRRTPTDAIWGWAGVEKDVDLPVLQQFLAELDAISAEHDFSNGIYADFRIDATHNFSSLLPKKSGFTTLDFLRKMTAPRVELQALLAKYRNDTTHPMSIVFWTTAGRI